MKAGTYHHSEETREKMRIARGNPSPLKGKHSPLHGKRQGAGNPNWKGGERKSADGYVLVLQHDHPGARVGGYIKRSRIVMEAHLGRTLLPTEVVHHINGIKTDDRIENLALFSRNAEHVSHHRRKSRKVKI